MLEILFNAAHLVALVGWVALLFSPAWTSALIGTARLASVLLAASYTLLFVAFSSETSELAANYSLDGVGAFFASPGLQLLGWVHYLAFDLWVGAWEAEEAARIDLALGLLMLSLLLPFLLGPLGLLTFLVFRAVCGGSRALMGTSVFHP